MTMGCPAKQPLVNRSNGFARERIGPRLGQVGVGEQPAILENAHSRFLLC